MPSLSLPDEWPAGDGGRGGRMPCYLSPTEEAPELRAVWEREMTPFGDRPTLSRAGSRAAGLLRGDVRGVWGVPPSTPSHLYEVRGGGSLT